MDIVGRVIFALIFIVFGINHIRNHAAMVSYTTTTMGNCPVAARVGYLGGWPTGLFLALFGAGVLINGSSFYAYGLAGFLAVATALFHRDLQDPMALKNIALFGAALFIASQAH